MPATSRGVKPWLLISVGLVWLGAVVLVFVFVRGGFGVFVGGGRFAQIKLDVILFIGFFLLLGWLIPLSLGVLRLLKRSR